MPRDLFSPDNQATEELATPQDAARMTEDARDMSNVQVVGSSFDDLESQPPSQSPFSANFDDAAVKPYVQTLNALDLESCIKLEEAVLPKEQRTSRETLEYWFSTCGELSLGVFTSADTTDTKPAGDSETQPRASTAETASTANPVYSGTPARKSVLLGHVIATKIDGDRISPNDRTLRADNSGTHKPYGRTIAIQSFAVLPAFQNHGLGTMLLRSYIQRIEGSGLAEHIAIVAAESKVEYMKWFGFQPKGPSKAGHGGNEQWIDLALEVSKGDSD